MWRWMERLRLRNQRRGAPRQNVGRGGVRVQRAAARAVRYRGTSSDEDSSSEDTAGTDTSDDESMRDVSPAPAVVDGPAVAVGPDPALAQPVEQVAPDDHEPAPLDGQAAGDHPLDNAAGDADAQPMQQDAHDDHPADFNGHGQEVEDASDDDESDSGDEADIEAAAEALAMGVQHGGADDGDAGEDAPPAPVRASSV